MHFHTHAVFRLQEELLPHFTLLSASCHPETLPIFIQSPIYLRDWDPQHGLPLCFQILVELFLIHNLNSLTWGDTRSRGGYILPLISCCKHLSPLKCDFFSLKMKGCFQKHYNDLSFFFFPSIQFMTHITNLGCKTFSCYNVQKLSGKVIICFIKVKFAADRWMEFL